MSTTTDHIANLPRNTELRPPAGIPHKNYLSRGESWQSWLLTTDHKRIAILYLLAITFFFFVGGFGAMVIRLHLLSPHGALVTPHTYNRMFTMHGVVMVWFFLIPAVPAVLGNFLIPMMVGARDVAFPRLNLLSWYLFMIGGVLILYVVIYRGADTGWTFYAPLSTRTGYSYDNVALTFVAVIFAGFSSILTAINFLVTTHTMRAPGLTWFRLPIFVWSHYSYAILTILATPVLAITLAALLLERLLQIGIFDPRLGGDPVLMQHLFWFYSHPAVYIMLLPGMGIISELVACFSRRPLFGYRFVAMASIALGFLSFLVWGHHMFTTSQSPLASLIFSFLSFMVAIPSAVKVFNWTATLHKGSIRLDTPMLYALGFIALFTMGGLTGLHIAAIAGDVHFQDTYFVVAHFHYIMVGGTVMAFLGGIHFWWPKMTGRLYPEWWGRLAAMILLAGFILTFFPQFILGYEGMPRRYATYAPEFQMLNVLSSAGASILGVGYLLPFGYLLWSLRNGEVAGPNPWQATGLEWQTSSPPPHDNFITVPVVNQPPYQYSPQDDDAANTGRDGQLPGADGAGADHYV